jgi:hypothetical protein
MSVWHGLSGEEIQRYLTLTSRTRNDDKFYVRMIRNILNTQVVVRVGR